MVTMMGKGRGGGGEGRGGEGRGRGGEGRGGGGGYFVNTRHVGVL